MKITHVICQVVRIEDVEAKTAGTQDTVIIRIRTDEGLEGIGETDASPEVVKSIIDAPFSHTIACGLREVLIGEDPLDTDRIWSKMYRRTMYYGRRGVVITAMGGGRPGTLGSQGKVFQPADLAPAGRASSQWHPRLCVDPVRPGRIRDPRDRPALARSRLRGHQVRLGAHGRERGSGHRAGPGRKGGDR